MCTTNQNKNAKKNMGPRDGGPREEGLNTAFMIFSLGLPRGRRVVPEDPLQEAKCGIFGWAGAFGSHLGSTTRLHEKANKFWVVCHPAQSTPSVEHTGLQPRKKEKLTQ